MTRIAQETVKCSVCGKESKQPALLSSNTSGSMDLDARPPEMQRSTMPCWVSECPHCGYVASSLENPIRCDAEFLKTAEYRNFSGAPPVSELAQRFVRRARISLREANYARAFWDYLHAAWASDDKKDATWQIELRILALQMMEKFGDQDMNDHYRIIRADLLRKTRQFGRLLQEYEHVRLENDLLHKILQFQIVKAKNKDTATYTVKDVSP